MCPQIGMTYDFCDNVKITLLFCGHIWIIVQLLLVTETSKKNIMYFLIRDYEDELNYTFLLMNKAERLGCFLCMQINFWIFSKLNPNNRSSILEWSWLICWTDMVFLPFLTFFYLSLIFWVGFFMYIMFTFFSLFMLRFFKKISLIYLSPLIPLSFFYPHFIIEEAWLVQEDVGWIAIAIFLEA